MNPYYQQDGITIYHGDCRDVLSDQYRVDGYHVTVTDPPYGVTDHAWDKPVSAFHWMRGEAAVVTASEPYATELLNEGPLQFCYDLVWIKNTVSNAFNAAKMPMRAHERVLVFGEPRYRPVRRRRTAKEMERLNAEQRVNGEWAMPDSVIAFNAVNNRDSERTEHPSQKPVDLFAWLIRSFSGDLPVVDPFMGSGTTLVAAKRLGRAAIGIEQDERFCEIAVRRLSQAVLFGPDGDVQGAGSLVAATHDGQPQSIFEVTE